MAREIGLGRLLPLLRTVVAASTSYPFRARVFKGGLLATAIDLGVFHRLFGSRFRDDRAVFVEYDHGSGAIRESTSRLGDSPKFFSEESVVRTSVPRVPWSFHRLADFRPNFSHRRVSASRGPNEGGAFVVSWGLGDSFNYQEVIARRAVRRPAELIVPRVEL